MKNEEGETPLKYDISSKGGATKLSKVKNDKDLELNTVDNEGQKPLMKSSIQGMTTIVLELIKRGGVHIKDIHAQIDLGNEDITLIMIKHSKDLDLNGVNNRDQTPLMKVAIRGMVKAALPLIKRGADVNMKDKEGKTALMYAMAQENADTALAIIEHSKDLDVNAMDNQGQTALMTAAINGMTTFALELIKRGADVNMKDKEGKTALMYAMAQENADTALAIIEHSKDLDVNAMDNQGQTALMTAAINGMTTFALELIKRGADVNMKDKEGKTVLMYAIEYGSDGIAVALISETKDFSVNSVDNQGRTALMKAAIRGMVKTALALIKRGADVNLTDREGKTVLMFPGFADAPKDSGSAAKELTLALIDAGADVNKIDNEGNTALIYNVKYEASVKTLIEQGKALVDHKNHLGRTALFYAQLESIASARYLVKHGANVHLKDNYNVSVLSYVIHNYINSKMSDIFESHFGLLKMNGIKRKSIVNEIINAVFCKLPLVKTSLISKNAIISLLRYAADISRERRIKGIRRKKLIYEVFEHLAFEMGKSTDITHADLLKVLGKLIDIGADPNTSDEQGKNVCHYIVLLGLDDYADVTALLFLEEKGLQMNQMNHSTESPLISMLSNAICYSGINVNMEFVISASRYFLQRDFTLNTTTSSGETVFHLVIKLSNKGDMHKEPFGRCLLELLEMFKSHLTKQTRATVNRGDDEMNTPLHIWAASPPKSNFQGLSAKILALLLHCGAVPYMKNLKGETPLHVCRTWTAVKLLVKAGAMTNDGDETGRTPLLSAAHNSLFLKNPGCFYPDVSPSESPSFWRTVMNMGFNLWTCDKNGDTIISNLIKGNSFELADGLIEIACDNNKILSDETLLGMLNALCKDDSTETTWKSILVDKLLTSTRRRLLDVSAPLRSCCINIKNYVEVSTDGSSETNSVHYQIAKQLLTYCYVSAESCLDVAEGCPPLQALLSSPICIYDVPLVIPWTAVSKRYESMLAGVARRKNCEIQGPYWYHNEYIARGAFGHVFVGIHEKDGMEVAIKKVSNFYINRTEDLREVRTFARLPNCEHIVRYLAFLESSDFLYIIMELMEGNLVEYFDSEFYDQRKGKELCHQVILGLKYLHEHNIIHRDLQPTKILFRTHPEFRLKIADFGLSRPLDINASFTVMATGVGTRGWIAPEVMKSAAHKHYMSSDIFSMGLILHYILSNQRHPYSPANSTENVYWKITTERETNILRGDMEGWDSSLDPDSSMLITEMLRAEEDKRPTASTVSDHLMFWPKKKKLDFLSAVGNQEEFECPRTKRTVPLTLVEQDLENKFATIVKLGSWTDPRYTHTSVIFIEMQKPIVKHDKKGKPYTVPARKYDIGSAVELVRFIRNAIAHVSEASRPSAIRITILEDAVFLDEFPSLVMEVFKAVTAHGWDVSREEIKHVLAND